MLLTRLLALTVIPACSPGTTPPSELRIANAELRVLFVGNSLTYTNDLPGMVAALARLEGRSFAAGSIAYPNVSLEDHAARGTLDVIRRERPDVVVMQQGPSSLAESRIDLVDWTRQFDAVIRESGGRTALLMVWPPTDRIAFFDDVRESYRAAADAIGGMFIPAGESWRAIWRRDASVPLYGADGFHPSALGTLAAALTVHAVLFELDASSFRCPQAVQVGVTAGQLEVICASVLEAVTTARAARPERRIDGRHRNSGTFRP